MVRKLPIIASLETTLSVSESISIISFKSSLAFDTSLILLAYLYCYWFTGKTIGSGTFGKVREGIHQLTSEKVAIKILEKDKIKD